MTYRAKIIDNTIKIFKLFVMICYDFSKDIFIFYSILKQINFI
jgi:hypothetical protein